MLLLGLSGVLAITRLGSFRVATTVWRAGPNLARFGCLGLHEWPVALDLLVPHDDEPSNDCDPVEAVGNHGAVGSGVIPAQDGLEDSPAATTVQVRRAALRREGC